jgi:hypothetical protein
MKTLALNTLLMASVFVGFTACGSKNKSVTELKSFRGEIVVGIQGGSNEVYQEVYGTLLDMQAAGVPNVLPNENNGLTLESQDGFLIECNSTYQGQYCILKEKPDGGATCGSCGDTTGYFLHTWPSDTGFNKYLADRLNRNPRVAFERSSSMVVSSLVDSRRPGDALICARNKITGIRSCGFSHIPEALDMGKAVVLSAQTGR